MQSNQIICLAIVMAAVIGTLFSAPSPGTTASASVALATAH